MPYVVVKPFEGPREKRFAANEKVDTDKVNSWLHGQRLVANGYLVRVPDKPKTRGRKPTRRIKHAESNNGG